MSHKVGEDAPQGIHVGVSPRVTTLTPVRQQASALTMPKLLCVSRLAGDDGGAHSPVPASACTESFGADRRTEAGGQASGSHRCVRLGLRGLMRGLCGLL